MTDRLKPLPKEPAHWAVLFDDGSFSPTFYKRSEALTAMRTDYPLTGRKVVRVKVVRASR